MGCMEFVRLFELGNLAICSSNSQAHRWMESASSIGDTGWMNFGENWCPAGLLSALSVPWKKLAEVTAEESKTRDRCQSGHHLTNICFFLRSEFIDMTYHCPFACIVSKLELTRGLRCCSCSPCQSGSGARKGRGRAPIEHRLGDSFGILVRATDRCFYVAGHQIAFCGKTMEYPKAHAKEFVRVCLVKG